MRRRAWRASSLCCSLFLMRIVIATGIYPPEIGGPALYAEGVKKALEASGHRAPLVLFGSLRKLPSGVRHLLYGIKLFFASVGADAIFAFDTYSVGVPAAFVGMLLRKPVLIRVGGDFAWESYVERTGDLVPLPQLYEHLDRLNNKERVAFRSVRWMLNHATLVFNTRWLINVWEDYYDLDEARCHVVENVIPERIAPQESSGEVLVFGRNLKLKNQSAFRKAFEAAHTNLSLVELSSMSRDELFSRIARAHAVAVPSISDVAPNSVIDALRCGKPFLLTKYSGYAEQFREYGVIVDPLSESDMISGIQDLADTSKYQALCERVRAFKTVRMYKDVAREMLELI